jgi:hypothetical protein
MATIARPRVITKWDLAAADLPEQVTVSLSDLVGSIKDGLLSFAVAIGLAVLSSSSTRRWRRSSAPRGRPPPRQGAAAGDPRRSPGGGQQTACRSLGGTELELDTYRLFRSRDLLTQAALNRMLAGLSTRRYRAGLEPIPRWRARPPPVPRCRDALSRAPSAS